MRRQRPIVPMEQEPLTEKQCTGMMKEAKCDGEGNPNGVHHFMLESDGDGPCTYCRRFHSEVHKKSLPKGGDRKVTTTQGKNKNENLLTVKDLAKKAGVEPRVLRRLLRKSFGGGDKKHYTWKPEDPQVQEIVAAAKNGGKEKSKSQSKAKAKVNKKAKAVTATQEPGKGEASVEDALTPEA